MKIQNNLNSMEVLLEKDILIEIVKECVRVSACMRVCMCLCARMCVCVRVCLCIPNKVAY